MNRLLSAAAITLCMLAALPPPTASAQSDAGLIDLTTAVVVASPSATPRHRTAVRVLFEDVRKRAFVRLAVATTPP